MKAIIGFIVVFIISVVIGFYITSSEKRLPVYKPSDLNPRLVDSDQLSDQSPHHIRDFQLINHFGDTVTNDMVYQKVFIANFFFTRCPTICPVMTKNLVEVKKELGGHPDFMILSHTVTPEFDSPEVLYAYAEKFGANQNGWVFLTGEKREIYDLARRSYFAVLDHGDGGMQDFIHTENIVLVDTQRRIRGFYDGTSEREMNKMIEDIKDLLRE